MKQTITYSTLENLPLQGSFYETEEPTKKGVILYIHGGGLIYGTRDDLPEKYIQKFLATGYSFLALDYPLVPEVRIDTIFNTLEEGILSLPTYPDLAHENWENVYYFGRSAGAFMTMLLGASEKLPQPQGIIALYGYYSLTDPMMQQRSAHYQKFSAVPFMEVQKLIQTEPIAVAPIFTRFPIYMSYRQSGTWVKELLGRKNKAEDFSLTEDDLKKFPGRFQVLFYPAIPC